jgi:hypothetical protein
LARGRLGGCGLVEGEVWRRAPALLRTGRVLSLCLDCASSSCPVRTAATGAGAAAAGAGATFGAEGLPPGGGKAAGAGVLGRLPEPPSATATNRAVVSPTSTIAAARRPELGRADQRARAARPRARA